MTRLITTALKPSPNSAIGFLSLLMTRFGFERILIPYRPHAVGVEIQRVVHGSRNLQAFLRREGLE